MDEQPFHKRVPARLRGLLILVPGLVLGWWQIWLPLTALDRGESEVTIHNLGIGGAVLLIVFGGLLTLIGQGFENALEAIQPDSSGKISPHFLMVVRPVAALAIAAYVFVQMRLAAMGYTRT